MEWMGRAMMLISMVAGLAGSPSPPSDSRIADPSPSSRPMSTLISPPAASPTRCTVRVTEGWVAGRRDGRSCTYRGLRYAASPTGPRRFRPPAAPPQWNGLRQLPSTANYACPRIEANSTESYVGEPPSSVDEDCLRVTVTTPARAGDDRSVIVYLHGGAFLSGSGFQSDFNGRHLAVRGDAVVVTVNYRLGLFGYLELGDLSPAFRGSGNNGLRDQIAALRWTRRNAAAFGGDARNITVMGESAGAISISAMLAGDSPETLFRRAIVQSGNGYLVHTRDQARERARQVLDVDNVATVSQLQQLTTSELLTMQADVLDEHPIQRSTFFAPFVDGRLVRGDVLSRLAQGSARKVDLLIGSNRDEVMFFALDEPILVYLPALANPFFPASLRARQLDLIATYGRGSPVGGLLPGRKGTTVAMMSDQLFRVPAIRMAEAQRRWNDRTYMYRFDWAPNAPPSAPPHRDVGAMHTLELPFVFGTLRLGWVPYGDRPSEAEQLVRERLSHRMLIAWTRFARTGSPNPRHASGVPEWKPYDLRNRYTLRWSERPALVRAPADARRAAWDAYPFTHFDYPLPIG